MATDPSAERFRRYWTRLDLREKAYDVPAPCISWRRVPGLNQVEALVWATVRGASTLLDYGSGDQRPRRSGPRTARGLGELLRVNCHAQPIA